MKTTCVSKLFLVSVVSLMGLSFFAVAAPPAGDWTLVLSDEFDGPSLDTSLWGYGEKPWGTTDNSPCLITPEDTYLENGNLVLRSRMGDFGSYNFTSGWAWTKVWKTYGYMEIRAQYPAGKGQWPAWWMLRDGWPPEFDIAEFRGASGPANDYMTQAVYDEAAQWSSNTIGGDYTGWHIYGFEWGPGYLKWYIDGSLTYTVIDPDIPTQSMYVILSAGLDSNADATTGFPNYFVVDYFRWYQTPMSYVDVDDGDASITYSGNWGTYSGNPGYNETEHYSETTGSEATFTFVGNKVWYYGFKRNDLGHADILLDGELVATVDCYGSPSQYYVPLYESPKLNYDTHTLTVRVKGTKNVASSGTEIIVDAFGYSRPPNPPANPAIFPGDEEVTLSWDNSPGMQVTYNIYSSTTSGGPYNLIATDITETSYTDTGLTNCTTYYYVVTAVDDYGDESVYSNELSETPKEFFPITVENYSFELPGTVKQSNWTNVPGWSSDVTAGDSGVEQLSTTDGSWRGFLMGSDPPVWQITSETIAADNTYVLEADMWNTSEGFTMTVSMFYVNDLDEKIELALKEYVVDGLNYMTAVNGTVAYTVPVGSAAIGKNLGIMIDNNGGSWTGVDNVRLSYGSTCDLTPPSFTTDPIINFDGIELSDYTGQSLATYADDPSGIETLTFSKDAGPGWLVVSPDGTLSGIPRDSNVGENTFTVRVTDNTSLSDTAQMTIQVANIYSGVRGVEDLAGLAAQWLMLDCVDIPACDGADLDGDNNVTISDFSVLAYNWLVPEELQLYLKLDEASGDIADDDSVYGRSGLLFNGPVWSSGISGGALDFDGVDDYVEIPGYKGITGGASRTCCAWIKTSDTTSWKDIISWGDAGVGQWWLWRINSAGLVQLSVMGGYQQGTTAVNDGQWHHVVVVLNDSGSPTTNDIEFYVDGVKETSYTTASQVVDTAENATVKTGIFSDTYDRYFKGLIDEVRIYDTALTEQEIQVMATP